ncbi:MAG: hypothetical protein MUE51_07745 [Thermoleophilia bacterium]|jgi:hypothetical protein|nr:hypothetical protein [Thermoleophilia bacterium]
MGSFRGVGDVLVTARPYEEYRAMFGLTDAEVLAGPVLDCPGGCGGFAAGVRARGGRAVSMDPAYALDPDALLVHGRDETLRGNRYVRDHPGLYVWTFFGSLGDHRRRRLGALRAFADDRRAHPEAYVAAALPRLPLADGAVRLALSAHLLFTYPDHLDHDDHLAAMRELLRVARDEVRLFPLVDTTLVRHPGLEDMRAALAAEGVRSEVVPVGYEFQRGADEYLRLTRG